MQATLKPAPVAARESIRGPQPVARNIAVDAYRGCVMLLMMAEVLELARVAHAYPGNWFWAFLGYNQTHVDWAGCSSARYDSAVVLVSGGRGAALLDRQPGCQRGHLRQDVGARHLAVRLLVALGVFLRSMDKSSDVFHLRRYALADRPGLSAAVLCWASVRLAGSGSRWALLTGYWLAWALYPVAGPGFNWQSVGVPANWHHFYTGFAAHWNKNANLGNAFDQWFLNLFPRSRPFVYNDGGYLTLSFIPTLGTMILGLVAGRWLRASAPRIPMQRLVIAGVIGMASGLLLHFTGICPIVKRIWTPSWTLFSGGICFLF